jgi:hypothetical protein
MKTGTAETLITVEVVERGFDLETLTRIERTEVRRGEAAYVRCRSRALIAIDEYSRVCRGWGAPFSSMAMSPWAPACLI